MFYCMRVIEAFQTNVVVCESCNEGEWGCGCIASVSVERCGVLAMCARESVVALRCGCIASVSVERCGLLAMCGSGVVAVATRGKSAAL